MCRSAVAASLFALALAAPVSSPQAQRSGGYTLRDIAPHAIADDCWIVLERSVYVITDYLPGHHGAPEDLVTWCGTDASAALEALGKEGRKLHRQIEEYRIGKLQDDPR
jgi:cytochrome b involved in lipid metabolism